MTFFVPVSCQGFPVGNLSRFPWEEGTVVPPYEMFQVTGVKETPREKTVHAKSVGVCSNHNCGKVLYLCGACRAAARRGSSSPRDASSQQPCGASCGWVGVNSAAPCWRESGPSACVCVCLRGCVAVTFPPSYAPARYLRLQ
ncbi:unnamed protein product [Eretmochelys imbricata]